MVQLGMSSMVSVRMTCCMYQTSSICIHLTNGCVLRLYRSQKNFEQDNLDQLIVGNGPKEVIAKICLDQLLWCPIFMVCYFSYLGIANGDTVYTIFNKINDDLFTAVTASWKIWPAAHAIQFRWVATKHRIVYINCIEVCFIMFLSFLANR
jgi:protein Mpv17